MKKNKKIILNVLIVILVVIILIFLYNYIGGEVAFAEEKNNFFNNIIYEMIKNRIIYRKVRKPTKEEIEFAKSLEPTLLQEIIAGSYFIGVVIIYCTFVIK